MGSGAESQNTPTHGAPSVPPSPGFDHPGALRGPTSASGRASLSSPCARQSANALSPTTLQNRRSARSRRPVLLVIAPSRTAWRAAERRTHEGPRELRWLCGSRCLHRIPALLRVTTFETSVRGIPSCGIRYTRRSAPARPHPFRERGFGIEDPVDDGIFGLSCSDDSAVSTVDKGFAISSMATWTTPVRKSCLHCRKAMVRAMKCRMS